LEAGVVMQRHQWSTHAMTNKVSSPASADLGPSSTGVGDPPSPEERLQRVLQDNPWMRPDAIASITKRIGLMNSSFRSKQGKLFRLADDVNRALQPHTACRNGCSHCCSLVTLVYRFEAEVLAEVSGRKMVEVPERPRDQVIEAANSLTTRKVCPFLVEGRCSVYEHRPLICRVHHSLNEDPADCDESVTSSERRQVLKYDPDHVEMPYHQAVCVHRPSEPWGTVHEFFPTDPAVSAPE
jgi:Fe-S-cluster containining protein